MNLWLVHCAGKVASVSISQALARAGLATNESRVFKTHVLNPARLAASGAKPGSEGHLRASREFLELFHDGRFDKCHVIVGHRDPVSQAVSAFFQNLSSYVEKSPVTIEAADEVLDRLRSTIDKLLAFVTKVWWEQEFAEVFGVDALTLDFDKQAGVSCTELSDRTTLVLYTLERGLGNLAPVLERLSGREPICIDHLNAVSDSAQFKPYENRQEVAGLYEQVREQFRLPATTLEEIYSRRSSRFFYNQGQLSEFAAKWVE